MMSVQEEFEPNFNARWAWEEKMHILEEEEMDWRESHLDHDEYVDFCEED